MCSIMRSDRAGRLADALALSSLSAPYPAGDVDAPVFSLRHAVDDQAGFAVHVSVQFFVDDPSHTLA